MRHTTLVRTGLSVLLILGTWAAAGTTEASAADSPSATVPQASAGLIQAMRHDLGLTSSQATARLAAEKTATALQAPARRAAGAAYGGSWFDSDSGKLTVAVTDA